MTKGKKWTLRLLGVAALALLICLCLLGSTMARYTSTGEGKGTLTVALWDLEVAKVDIDVDKISPSQAAYSDSGYGATNPRTNDCGQIDAFTMVNNSDVDALVTFDLGSTSTNGVTITKADDFTWGIGWTGEDDIEYNGTNIVYDADGNTIAKSGRAQTNAYGKDIMSGFGSEDTFLAVVNAYKVISLDLVESDGTAVTTGTQVELAAKDSSKTDQTDNKETIKANVVWTSIYEGADVASSYLPSTYGFGTTVAEDWQAFSDAVDSILGMYYTEVSFAVTWTAVQASTLPPAKNP